MIKELQIRPFARPLLVWIAGIMLQTVFSCCTYSWVLLLLPVIILTTAGLALRGQEHFCYETRWLWGVVFLSLLLFLSIQKTACSQFEASSEHPASLLSRWAREEQQRLLEPIAKLNLTDEEKSVLATITVGYRQVMSRESDMLIHSGFFTQLDVFRKCVRRHGYYRHGLDIRTF